MFPEKEKQESDYSVVERPDEASPLTIERKEVVTPKPVNFNAQVKSDDGKNLISTPQSSTITISLPADDAQLQSASKGKSDDSVTWWGLYWLRMIKKAIHFGWKMVSARKE